MIRLENVLKISLRDVLKTSWRRFTKLLEDVLKDVLKTFRRHDQDKYICLDQDVLKTSSEDVRLKRTYSSWSRRLQDLFGRRRRKTSASRRMFAGYFLWNILHSVNPPSPTPHCFQILGKINEWGMAIYKGCL